MRGERQRVSAVTVLAIVVMLIFRPKPENADSPLRKTHEALLQ